MATISSPRHHQSSDNRRGGLHHHHHGPVVEEIEGLIKVFNDGCVERPPIVPTVSPTLHPSAKATAFDIKLSNDTWTRVYIPDVKASPSVTLPLLVYFHGGGFCVGSAAWSCYHDFLTDLAVKARCVVVSVNYRLAPEHRLPAAYDDGVNVVSWLVKEKFNGACSWLSKCNLSNVFLAGDSAGANIAYQVAVRITTNVSAKSVNTLNLKGVILIHPFFGGESRTTSEKQQQQHSMSSSLTLSASDTYWRLALPRGAGRDHPWCNPLVNPVGYLREAKLPATMVFVAEFDILKDRNLEMCRVMRSHGKRVEGIIHGGVGHAFHILDNSAVSRDRIYDMMCRLQNFINP